LLCNYAYEYAQQILLLPVVGFAAGAAMVTLSTDTNH